VEKIEEKMVEMTNNPWEPWYDRCLPPNQKKKKGKKKKKKKKRGGKKEKERGGGGRVQGGRVVRSVGSDEGRTSYQ